MVCQWLVQYFLQKKVLELKLVLWYKAFAHNIGDEEHVNSFI